jgi:hypothetical protein
VSARRGRHEPLVITIRTPRRKITLGSARDAAEVLRSALADAENYRRMRADSPRADRATELALAAAYQGLAAEIAWVLPESREGGGES